MSLDVYLVTDVLPLPREPMILIREKGEIREIGLKEWERRYPGREPVYTDPPKQDYYAYEANITHNLAGMAAQAGIYMHLWRPDEMGITKAKQLIEPLTEGLALLESDPEGFRALNPANGWGDYEGLVRFVSNYLKACKSYPDATVRVSR